MQNLANNFSPIKGFPLMGIVSESNNKPESPNLTPTQYFTRLILEENYTKEAISEVIYGNPDHNVNKLLDGRLELSTEKFIKLIMLYKHIVREKSQQHETQRLAIAAIY